MNQVIERMKEKLGLGDDAGSLVNYHHGWKVSD